MKTINHSIKAVLCLVLLVAVLAGITVPADAAEKYMEGEHAYFEIYLDEDGGATIRETWDCYFGGDTITRYRRHYTLPDPDACTIEVWSVLIDGEEMTLLDAPDDSRPEGCAAVYQEGNETHIEMYLSALEESHSFEITYYVTNAVILYNDVAEFHWNLSSEHEAFDIAELTGYIEIPYGTRDKGLYFWGHGPEENSYFDAIVEDGMVNSFELYTENVAADQSVNVRFAMPLELFPGGSRMIDERALDRILDEEHGLIDDSQEQDSWEAEGSLVEKDPYYGDDAYEENETSWQDAVGMWLWIIWDIVRWILGGIAIAVCVLPLLIGLVFGKLLEKIAEKSFLKKQYQKRMRPVSAPQYYRSLPDDLTPAMVYKLTTVYPVKGEGKEIKRRGNPFSATVLDLIERGLIEMGRNAEDEVTYRVTDLVDSVNLSAYEQSVIEFYTTAGADLQPMTTPEITTYMRTNYSWCKDLYRDFYSSTDEAFSDSNLATEYPSPEWSKSRLTRVGLMNLAIIFFGLVGLVGPLAAIAVAVLMMLINSAFLMSIDETLHPAYMLLTQEGENRYAMWMAYRRFLEDFTTFEDLDVNDLRIWRRYLVYAAALGCSEKVIENLKMVLPEVYESFVNDPYLSDYDMVFASAAAIDTEGGYTIRSSSSSSDSDSSDSDDWGGFSDSGGDSDSGSSGSDFD